MNLRDDPVWLRERDELVRRDEQDPGILQQLERMEQFVQLTGVNAREVAERNPIAWAAVQGLQDRCERLIQMVADSPTTEAEYGAAEDEQRKHVWGTDETTAERIVLERWHGAQSVGTCIRAVQHYRHVERNGHIVGCARTGETAALLPWSEWPA